MSNSKERSPWGYCYQKHIIFLLKLLSYLIYNSLSEKRQKETFTVTFTVILEEWRYNLLKLKANKF